ncbi:uncharacterized protein CBL_00170 [Carabus blaptoides fortunei]
MQVFVSDRVCLPDGLQPAKVFVQHGKITKIVKDVTFDSSASDPNIKIINFGSNVLMAGIVDSHVHVNEPGRTPWEGYLSATKAAAAGGVTTIIDMPLNSIPPTTTLENFLVKQKSTEGQIYVDVGFWGGLISGNQDELLMLIDAGVVGFKCFMCPSGVDEFPNVVAEDIRRAVEILENKDAVLAFHAEMEENIDVRDDDPTKYTTFLKTRPASMEVKAIRTILDACRQHNVKCHIVHLSAAESLPLIEQAKQDGCQVTVETCHHYLSLKAEDVPDKATQYKCCPPIRDGNNREKLWKALTEKKIDLVVSDHSPCTPDLKCFDSGNFLEAWGGISSLQFGLSLFWTEARNRGFDICQLSALMSASPAKLCGLQTRKGQLTVGFDADFVVWNPETEIEIAESTIFHKNKITPYLGKKLYGKVLQTFVRGQSVFENGQHCDLATGKLLKRNTKM